jgi:hypothetical protein
VPSGSAAASTDDDDEEEEEELLAARSAAKGFAYADATNNGRSKLGAVDEADWACITEAIPARTKLKATTRQVRPRKLR